MQVTKEDGLPKNICQRCIYKLDMFYEFRLSCITTETMLKNYADSLKNITALTQVNKTFFYTRRILNYKELNDIIYNNMIKWYFYYLLLRIEIRTERLRVWSLFNLRNILLILTNNNTIVKWRILISYNTYIKITIVITKLVGESVFS